MRLEDKVRARLSEVIDPETGMDVIRMRLVEDLQIDETTGEVKYKFRPSSPLCPLAVHLALDMREAVASVPGVRGQQVEVVGYVGAAELNALLRGDGPGARP
jgi:metal-sulfur cluster biosynthetic enzyme